MINIIIIDDEPNIREGLKLLINWEKLNYKIIGEASNGSQGLELIQELKPQVVITDIKMPELSGLDIIESCNKSNLNIQFIILSGHSEFHMAQKALKLGASNYLLKPVDEDELEEALIKIKNNICIDSNRQITDKYLLEANFKQLLTLDKIVNLNEIKESFNITTQRSFYYVILDTYNEIELDVIENVIRKSIPSNYPFCLNYHSEGCYGLCIHSGMLTDYNNNINVFLMDLIATVFKNIGKSISVYLGLRKTSFEFLKESMTESVKSLNHRYYRDKGVIIDYQNIQYIDFNYTYNECLIIDNLFESINTGDLKEGEKLIDELILYFKENNLSAQIIYMHLNKLLNLILNSIKKVNGNLDEILNAATFITNREEQIFLFTLKDKLLKLTTTTSSILNRVKNKNSLGFELKEYIDNNYQENINLKCVADLFKVNPAYLGQAFKKDNNISFNSYINSIRLNKAKELLIETNHKIYQVATHVGFQDVNYFMKKFEQNFNTTPKQFRKNNKKDTNI